MARDHLGLCAQAKEQWKADEDARQGRLAERNKAREEQMLLQLNMDPEDKDYLLSGPGVLKPTKPKVRVPRNAKSGHQLIQSN